ncbi:37S ribosomal protein S9, mitochondrial [Elasticomyces elasticus]|nr:37S ribosomal protein S9, mitochondrial [Elasticomyces elasticus]
MDAKLFTSGFRCAFSSLHPPARRRLPLRLRSTRPLSTTSRRPAEPVEPQDARSQVPREPVRAAPPIDFEDDPDASRNDSGLVDPDVTGAADDEADLDAEFSSRSNQAKLLPKLRVVPRSASYFTAKPTFTDDLLALQAMVRKYQILPMSKAGEAPRKAWKTHAQYMLNVPEPVRTSAYKSILKLLSRLNYIHPNLLPEEVAQMLSRYERDVNPFLNRPKPTSVDEYGRARGVGRRKSSHAVAWLVEGEGEVRVNGKSLSEAFGRIHDRESAVFALKATERLDKYNCWIVVRGGGTTGQAESITLAVAKALMVHEPLLKPALRRGEFVQSALYDEKRWLRYEGSKGSRKKEAWQAQGEEDARLG